MKLVVGADHGGYLLKNEIAEYLEKEGVEVIDVGCFSEDSVDYPDYAHLLCEKIISGEAGAGILVCGTGIGMAIACNRKKEIRAANCHDVYTAQMSKEHNNANVLTLGARVISEKKALEIVKAWLEAEFTGGRHIRRIEKFNQ